jgi:hypothetical protein
MFEHCVIELSPHDLLCFHVFKLNVANWNGHDFAISWIINMAGHHCPTSNLLHMIIHDPRVLYIAFGLHLCTKSHSTPNPVNEHLEMNDLLTKYFTHETTFFDEIVMTLRLQLKDIVNVTSTQMLLE